MDSYDKVGLIGQGTFGVVRKAKHKETGIVVAIKRIKTSKDDDGVSFIAIREIKLLQEIDHPNVIKLLDTFYEKGNIHLVFDYMVTDMEVVIKDTNILLKPGDVKSYLKMILEGLTCCHASWILHRDLKPSNLLISPKGILKISDFGLARRFGSPERVYTPTVVTRWYRAPELLYGARSYGCGVDMWSVGCIFAELLLRTPFLPGDTDLDQLGKIFAALGTVTEKDWPGMSKLPDFIRFQSFPGTPLKNIFTAASDDAVDLLSRMLKFDPLKRISAKEALQHRYFSTAPMPTLPGELVLPKPQPIRG